MLRANKSKSVRAERGGTFAIVASRYNAEYVDSMLRAAREELLNAGAHVRVVRVPGAFEIPAAAARLALSSPAAIICLGVIFQGETSHAQHIGWGVTHALAQIQVEHQVPIIHGVFVFDKVKHAKVRCLGAKHNRGTEAAHTALEMARVMASLGKKPE
ncbi:MAG TPA: 6,7-dimethyl-8-ribityllumazine synthase [Verrucomicrobiae bacterium]|jgi:6,7-dimethyl-8-ribityllumazine synthase|nr:6,7-dimethyl-8-ribityllumazine synthase [Verrucomicrobiae bacterium]